VVLLGPAMWSKIPKPLSAGHDSTGPPFFPCMAIFFLHFCLVFMMGRLSWYEAVQSSYYLASRNIATRNLFF